MQKATVGNNKSSTSRSRMNMNDSRTSPQRKKISQQSIRQFKIEIDHQIAKCLDTLDRQGLKFLKQTLKTSNIFNSTNLEIDEKNESVQSLNSVKGQMKMFQNQTQPKNKISQQQSKKSLKKDFLQENKKAFMKNKQPKKQFDSKNRSNSSARIKPPTGIQLAQETKISQSIKPNQVQKQKKLQGTKNASSSRMNQKQQNTNSRVVKKTVIQNKKTNEKISLGQKLKKTMTQLNISKVGPGKNNKNMEQKSQTNLQAFISNEPQQMIEQEIVQTNQHQYGRELIDNKSQAESQSIIKSSIMESYHEYTQPEIKISQKINPLKPSAKDKMNESESFLAESKIQESRLPQRQIDPKSFVEKLSASIQVNHEDLKQKTVQNTEKNQSAEMSLIVEKINKLSPQKLVEIQKYLDFIQNKSINQEKIIDPIIQQPKSNQVNLNNLPQVYSMESFQKYEEPQKRQEKIKAFQRCSSYNEDQLIANRNKIIPHIPKSESRKGMRQKKQKASMIYGSGSMKSASRSRIKIDMDFQHEDKSQQGIMIQKSQNLKPYLTSRRDGYSQNNPGEKIVLKTEKPLKMQKIDFNENQNLEKNDTEIMKKSSMKEAVNNFEVPTNKLKQQETLNDNIEKNESLKIENSSVKMLNISSKKIQIIKKTQPKTQLKFKILSNRGHSSLFGLTGIQLYTIQNKRVIISEKQLGLNSNSTSKLLYLFNGNHYTTQEENIFQSSLGKNEIIVELDKENSRIGGILIFNFNKSSLQNSKQVDQLQIYHNDQKMWKGTINPGSYNQTSDYATQIQFMPNFKFPAFEKSNKNRQLEIKKERTQIWIQKKQKEPEFSVPQQNLPVKNEQKVLYQSQNRRNNTIAYQIEKNDIAINFSTKKLSLNQGYQQVQQIKPKESNETKSRVQSVAFNQKPAFQKKTINTARQESYDEFDTMLKGLQQNINRQKSKSKLPPASVSLENQYASIQNKQKADITNIKYSYQTQNPKKQQKSKVSNNQVDDFMNDSIFNDKPHSRIPKIKRKIQPPKRQEQTQDFNKNNFKKKQDSFAKNNDINIDDFLGQLQDVMKNKESSTKKTSKTDKRIQIPYLPSGQIVQLIIYENWGHQAYVGLQAIQFFNDQGKPLLPQRIDCNKNPNNLNIFESLNNKNIMNRDQKVQTKLGFDKSSPTILTFYFSRSISFSLIRFWNYNGHRVHSNIGVKQIVIKINGKQSFMGQFKKNQSTPQNFFKNFEVILFTNDQIILKKIKENDWLTQIKNKIKQQRNLFKSTLINFNRPKTKNSEQKFSQKQNYQKPNQMVVKEIKLPKRACWQYEPPEMPEGNVLVFLLHDTWGDQNFIGLNGIQIFDGTGKILRKEQISKIRAFPSTTGQKNDKRVIENVLNGSNYTNLDSNIWLTTFQSDIQKLESGKPNTIIVQLYKKTKISGINFYNYSKTPERGVREIQIQINSLLAFRGYLKIFNEQNQLNSLHTTINFTKNIQLLEKMNYQGYNEDNIDQNVAFVNERKLVKI